MRAAAFDREGWRQGITFRRLRPYCAAAGALALLGVLLAAGSCSWFALPSYDDPRRFPASMRRWRWPRDAHAIPHIYAQSARDGAFAMGYVHAQDRLWQLELQRRIGQARLAAVVGEPGIETDRFLRTLGLYRVAERNFEKARARGAGDLRGLRRRRERLSGDPLRDAAAGVRAARSRARALAAADSLVWLKIMAWDLGDNFSDELLRARLAGKLDREQLQDLWAQHPDDPPMGPHGEAPAFDPAASITRRSTRRGRRRAGAARLPGSAPTPGC